MNTAAASPMDVSTAASAATQGRSLHMAPTADPKKAQAVGRQFEAMFVSQMMEHMFSGIKSDGWFGGGQAEEMFRPMLVEQYGKLVASHGKGIGIADSVAKTMLHLQEVHG
jgi:peptidoglycan hydrolase FlgJ